MEYSFDPGCTCSVRAVHVHSTSCAWGCRKHEEYCEPCVAVAARRMRRKSHVASQKVVLWIGLNAWAWRHNKYWKSANGRRVTAHLVHLAPATWAAEAIGTVRKRLPQLERFSHTNTSCARTYPVMKLLLTNAFGLLSKFGAFQHAVARSRSDIAIVTETKFTQEKASLSDSSMPGLTDLLKVAELQSGSGTPSPLTTWVTSTAMAMRSSGFACTWTMARKYLYVQCTDPGRALDKMSLCLSILTQSGIKLDPSGTALW